MPEIYVYLCGEGVDVWRPVQAEQLSAGVYRIAEQPYDRGLERWQFDPGSEVVCELISVENREILAAVRLADAR
jgi:hypothetical protein